MTGSLMFSFLSGVTMSLAQEPGVIWVGVSSIPCIPLFPLFSSATPRHWQSWSWSGSTGTRNVSGIYRMELLLPIPTWSPSARCVFAGNKGNFGLKYWIHPCGFQEPSVAISNFIMSPVLCWWFASLGRWVSLPVQGPKADLETGLWERSLLCNFE